jgi:hypothetical protein
MTPAELAVELGVDPKALRRWLRQQWPPLHPHSRWDVTVEQAQAARARFHGEHLLADAGAAATPAHRPARPTGRPPAAPPALTDEGWSPWVPLLESLAVAPLMPGVYMARSTHDGSVVYVGVAGERRGQGIRGRLNIYVSGKGLASGLGEAVFDRALADAGWLRDRLQEVEDGRPMRAKLWGRAAIHWAGLDVRWHTTAARTTALALEMRVLRALPQAPLWNRLR